MTSIIETGVATAKTKVRHRNDINKTLSAMPLAARRVLFMAIGAFGRIGDPRKVLGKDRVFRIYASEYAKFSGIDASKGYEQLKAAAAHLQQQVIEIPKDQLLPWISRPGELPWKKPKGKGVRMLNVTEFCDYEEGDGYVDIMFSRSMEPYVCMIERDYTTQVLLSAMRLRDTNASNLYQLIRNRVGQKKTSYFDIGVNELRQELGLYTQTENGISYSYPEFKSFNRAVLKKSIATIENITEIKDISVNVIERKSRKAHTLRFNYRIDDQIQFDGF